MKKPNATLIIIALFCLLFTISLAHAPSHDDDVTTTEANSILRLPTETESNSAAVSSVPLTKTTFRTVNRRFAVRSRHPCRHHHREIPYGDDMIFSSGENSDFEDPVRRIHGRRVRIQHRYRLHGEESDSDSDDEDEGRIKFKPYDHGRVDRENEIRVLKKLGKLENGEEIKKKKKNKCGFMRRVRKFWEHYF